MSPHTPPRTPFITRSPETKTPPSTASSLNHSPRSPRSPRPRAVAGHAQDVLMRLRDQSSKRDLQRELLSHASRPTLSALDTSIPGSPPRRSPSPSRFPMAPSPYMSMPSSPLFPGTPDSPFLPGIIRSYSGQSISIYLDGDPTPRSAGSGGSGLGLGLGDDFTGEDQSPRSVRAGSVSLSPCALLLHAISIPGMLTFSLRKDGTSLSPFIPSRSSSMSSSSISGTSMSHSQGFRSSVSTVPKETSSLAPKSTQSLNPYWNSHDQDRTITTNFVDDGAARCIRDGGDLSPLDVLQRRHTDELMMRSSSSSSSQRQTRSEEEDDYHEAVKFQSTLAASSKRQSSVFGTSYSVTANLCIHSAALISPPRSRPSSKSQSSTRPTAAPLSESQSIRRERSSSLSPTQKRRMLLHTASSSSGGYHRIITDENKPFPQTQRYNSQIQNPGHKQQQNPAASPPSHQHSSSQSTTCTSSSSKSNQTSPPAPIDYRNRALELQIDQEGFRAITASFRFQREDGEVLEFVAAPSDNKHDLLPGYPFHHSTFERHPVLRRLHVEGDDEIDYLPRQASLTIGKKNGIYKASGNSKKGNSRYCLMYEVRILFS